MNTIFSLPARFCEPSKTSLINAEDIGTGTLKNKKFNSFLGQI